MFIPRLNKHPRWFSRQIPAINRHETSIEKGQGISMFVLRWNFDIPTSSSQKTLQRRLGLLSERELSTNSNDFVRILEKPSTNHTVGPHQF